MVKIKTSPKPKKSLKNIQIIKLKKNAPIIPHSPAERLRDKDFIGRVILECLENNDPEGVVEAISTYFEVLHKTKKSTKAKASKSTLYHGLKGKNPTLKTLARFMHANTIETRK